jgi:class 3 adenylate cyclase/tetratricopeptide (TPR) repeat protein
VAGLGAEPRRFASPDAYTPEHLARKIMTSRSALEGERKQITVLFADLKGSMEMLADRDPEVARDILDPVLERMIETVHRYEGTVNQVMGDGVMALFGAPVSHEDHAVRACYAALDMHAALRRYADEVRRTRGIGGVQIRVGVNSGEVVVQAVGNDLRMDYTAVGQTTHLAARMEQLASPGTTLLAAPTAALAEGYVEVQALGALPVKGLGAPVEVYELVGARPRRSRVHAAAAWGLTPLVGREPELEAVREALGRVAAGQGQLVAIAGEPGAGKSRLVWEVVHSHRTHGWLVLEAGSVSYGKATPYLPLSEVLEAYFGVEAREDPARTREKVSARLLQRGLAPAPEPFLALLDVPVEDPVWQDLDPLQRRELTLEAVERLLLRESEAQPVLLVFEDLHWIDSETEAFVDRLIERLPAARVLLLVSYRPEYRHRWTGRPGYRELTLDPLPRQRAGELLEILLGGDPRLQPLKQLLVERTSGNPFFLEESVRTLVETKVLVGERGAYRLGKPLAAIQVPPTVQAVLASRIDRLPAEEKRLLQSAAVIGTDVPLTVLRAVADMPEDAFARSLASLLVSELLYEAALVPDVEVSFKHALTHEVAYGSLLHDRRTTLHARAFQAIERLYRDRLLERVEALARHALRGEMWGRAVDYLREAAARAYGQAAFAEAVERYEQALEALRHLPETPENIRRAIDVRLDLHVPLYTLGQVARLVQLHEEAEGLARQLDDQPRLGRVIMRMAVYAWVNGQYARGIDYATRALAIATARGDRELAVLAGHALAGNHFWRGDYREAAALFTHVVEGPNGELAKRRLGLAFGSPFLLGCCFLTWCFGLLGDFERASEYGDRAVRLADDAGQPPAQAAAYTYRAVLLALRGAFEEAGVWSERAVRLCETKGVFVWLPAAYLARGWALAWVGQVTEGLSYLEQAATLSESMGVKTSLAQFHSRWAEGLLLAGKTADARRAAERALDLARASSEYGNEADALQVLATVTATADPAEPATALGLYAQAEALADRLGARPIAARCRLGVGLLQGRLGSPGLARQALAEAAGLFEGMGMAFWLDRTRAAVEGLAPGRSAEPSATG